MAWSAVPTGWFASWSEDATNITVPIASFPELTAAEADGTTGDIRKIIFALLEQMWTKWNSLATADRCTRMTIMKTGVLNPETGINTLQYSFTFQTSVSAQDVADEPA